jgi:hypothetical protein
MVGKVMAMSASNAYWRVAYRSAAPISHIVVHAVEKDYDQYGVLSPKGLDIYFGLRRHPVLTFELAAGLRFKYFRLGGLQL